MNSNLSNQASDLLEDDPYKANKNNSPSSILIQQSNLKKKSQETKTNEKNIKTVHFSYKQCFYPKLFNCIDNKGNMNTSTYSLSIILEAF